MATHGVVVAIGSVTATSKVATSNGHCIASNFFAFLKSLFGETALETAALQRRNEKLARNQRQLVTSPTFESWYEKKLLNVNNETLDGEETWRCFFSDLTEHCQCNTFSM